jgi:hypothetical protein
VVLCSGYTLEIHVTLGGADQGFVTIVRVAL